MAEVLQFTVQDSFIKLGVQFKDPGFKLKKNILIASIIRGDELIVPCGTSTIEKGDKVVVVSDRKHHLEKLNEIFA